MRTRRYTFVTVTHTEDAGLAALQARSMARYCDPSLVQEVIVVENDRPGHEGAWRDRLLTEYGPLAETIRFIPGSEIADMPHATGWMTQQVLKLTVSASVTTDRYVVLDAKNALIAPLRRDFLESPSTGRPLLNGYPMRDHALRPYLERVMAFLRIPVEQHLDWFPRTSTPFTILTDEARDLVAHVSGMAGRPFSEIFLDCGLTEFFLYSGYLVSKHDLERCYEMTQPYCVQLWGDQAAQRDVETFIRRATQSECPFIAVHRKAIARMTDGSRLALGRLYTDAGLFPSVSDGVDFLRNTRSIA